MDELPKAEKRAAGRGDHAQTRSKCLERRKVGVQRHAPQPSRLWRMACTM
jgi:hypothetical protein